MNNEVKNVPELRFPEFSGEWKEKELGQCTNLITKGTTPKDKSGKGTINYIKVENIYNGKINPRMKININEHEGYLKRSKLEANDILFSIAGTLGRTAVVNKSHLPANTNQALAIIRGYEFETNFLITTLGGHAVAKYIRKNPTVGAQPNLSLNQVSKLIINTPSKNEQQKIGDFFSKLDRQIELEEQKLAKLEEQKKGYMQKIFSQEIRFKDDNGNSYPEWESAPLFDIFSATKGKSLSKDKISNDGKYECILYGEIYTTYAEKIESIVSRTNYYEGILSQKNDLIFPNSTTTNAWDLATFSSLQKNNVLIGGDISILRTKRSDISSLFYAYYLTNYLKLRKDIAKYAQGITIVHLSFNNFCKIKVQIPSLEEQNSITDFIDSLNQQQKLITNKIKLLKERKKGFLQKMFV